MRYHNFSAGPAALPDPVLEQVQEELMEWKNSGCSVMEVSHRGALFSQLAEELEDDLRSLINISSDYAVFFMHGGASGQFSAVPLNLLGGAESANYVESGHWARRAITEAKRYCKPNVVAAVVESEDGHGHSMPPMDEWQIDPKGAYLHLTSNETVDGLEFHELPKVSQPIVADFSSNILSQPMDINDYGVIYAGAQKNIGPAGMGVVVVRKDLLGRASPQTPVIMDYNQTLKCESMYNTPPTFAWYIAGLVFKWLHRSGGMKEIGKLNKRKSEKLYTAIDGNEFYYNPVATEYRSRMNVPFFLKDKTLEKKFLEEAEEARLLGLKGHRTVGGLRASIYNAIREESVDVLIAFMNDFARRYG